MNHYNFYMLENYPTTVESEEDLRLKKAENHKKMMIERNKRNSEKYARR